MLENNLTMVESFILCYATEYIKEYKHVDI